MVEREPSKLGVAGSNPVSRSTIRRWAAPVRTVLILEVIRPRIQAFAHVAQSVEHFLGKEEVMGSIPVMGLATLVGEILLRVTG